VYRSPYCCIVVLCSLRVKMVKTRSLKVTCSRWDPADVQYTVTEGPRHGRLTMPGGGSRVRTFSQDDVNNERLSYRHTEQGAFADLFRFDVRCGNEHLRGLEFGLDVLPAMIPLEVTGNLSVPYNKTVPLTSSLFTVTLQQFKVRQTCPSLLVQRVSKNAPTLASCSFDRQALILTILGM